MASRKRQKRTSRRETFISGREDMRWLRKVHLPKLSSQFKSAIITGNEDCPAKVEVFRSAAPQVNAPKIVFKSKRGCKLTRR